MPALSLTDRTRDARAALDRFLNTTLDERLAPRAPEELTQARLDLFRECVETVPAYGEFLREHAVDPSTIHTGGDLRRVPALTKQNYIQRHPLPALCRGGRLEGCDMVAVSSGSTGAPTVWPRFQADEWEIAFRFEQVFHDSFRAHERTTLAVVCFALGTWVGGMYTASCCRHLALKGYPITVVTPGNNKDEILRVVQALGPHFEQVVLLGYPPFLKDVIDTGRARGLDWSRFRIKLVMAGEVFSEEWRGLLAERAGAEEITRFSASLYGTADAGVLGCETPLSVAVRRFLATRPHAARALFGESRLPTLVQFDPSCRYFEVEDGRLLFTGDNGIPLVRYNILDTGGVLGCEEMLEFLRGYGCDPLAEAGDSRDVRALPFVWVFGRSDFTVSYYGANVYPENVTVGLERLDIREWVTGKFVLRAPEDEDHDAFLSVVVELAPGVEPDETKRQEIARSVESELLRLNSEFANYVPAERRMPVVALAPAGDPEWFPAGVKHQYTRR